jgi:WD40 repeat protein
VVSGSANGQIKVWTIPSVSQAGDSFGPNKEKSYCLASWNNAHGNEPIWDISIHPIENIFLSVGSDQSIGLWQTPDPSLSKASKSSNL